MEKTRIDLPSSLPLPLPWRSLVSSQGSEIEYWGPINVSTAGPRVVGLSLDVRRGRVVSVRPARRAGPGGVSGGSRCEGERA